MRASLILAYLPTNNAWGVFFGDPKSNPAGWGRADIAGQHLYRTPKDLPPGWKCEPRRKWVARITLDPDSPAR